MNIKDINPDAFRVVNQPLNINNLPQGSYSAVSQPEPPKPSFLQKAGSVLDMIFGGGKVGEAIGTEIAKAMAKPEEKKLITPGPTAGEIAGSALQSAALFTPVGRVAGAIGSGLGKVGIKTGAKILSNIGAGAVAGEAFDVASNLQEGKTGAEALKPGFGTTVGAGLPLVPPIVKGATRILGESVGVSTGAGYGAIKSLFDASAKGGAAKKAAVDALRGNTSPEQIVQEARGALGQIKNSRAVEYTRGLSALKESTKSYDISPIVESVKTNLNKFGVTLGENGTIDFSRSPIRFNSEAQKDITNIVETMSDYGSRKGDRTVVGIDSLKRALSDLYTPSGEARSFIQSVKDSARKILSEVPGYDAMASNYETKSKLINEIKSSLSLGDKASIDTSFRKLTTILRTNNEERKILAEELNAISGGKLIPTIAGQQMSEILPRGIARQIEGFGALGSILAGFGAPLLKMALFASPRVVGELVNALGIGAQAGNKLLDVLGVKGVKLISPGDRLLQTKTGQKLEKSVINSIKNPSIGMTIQDITKNQGNPAIASKVQTTKSATKVNTTKSITPNTTTKTPAKQSPTAPITPKVDISPALEKEVRFYIKEDIPIRRDTININDINGKGLKQGEVPSGKEDISKPVIVAQMSDGSYRLLDGRHRLDVLEKRGATSIDAIIGGKENPLATEARKYISAEEVFGMNPTLYRGTTNAEIGSIPKEGLSVSLDVGQAKKYAKGRGISGFVDKKYLDPKAKVIKLSEVPNSVRSLEEGSDFAGKAAIWARKQGYDVLDMSAGNEAELRILNKNVIKDSIVNDTLYHATTISNASKIEKTGFINTGKSVVGGEGRGVYLGNRDSVMPLQDDIRAFTNEETKVLPVKIKGKVFDATDRDYFANREQINREAERAGYTGVRFKENMLSGIGYTETTYIFNPKNVMVQKIK